MYAVIRTGGKQYRVQKDDVIKVERIAGAAGETVELDQVLMVDDGKAATVGSPLVAGARVAATVLDQARGEKVLVFKKKRRKAYRRLRGHRQELTVLRITDILTAGGRRRQARATAAAEPEAPAAAAVPEAVEAPELPVPGTGGPDDR